MKIFETPEIIISVFDAENVMTASNPVGPDAVTLAQQDAEKIEGSAGTFTIINLFE